MLKLYSGACLLVIAATSAYGALTPKVTHSGNIKASIDGAGSNNANGHDIRVDKPSAAASVRAAYLLAASTGYTGRTISAGQIAFAGQAMTFTDSLPSKINSWNYWTDVTAIVRPTLNAAPAGITTFHITEQDTYYIDGEILVVIWDEPSAPPTTITLMFGAQLTGGDSFTVTLAQPVDKTNPQTVLDMSLGISYSYQATSCQYSILEMSVNNQRISTSAGGEDDGGSYNGGLITVGGIGDTNANPPDPYHPGCNNPRYDDELYNLLPFVNNGDTSFTVKTQNPSNDDNIFFAAIILGANSAVVGEGILASPATGSSAVGGTQTVNALVQTSTGNPVVGRTVTCKVVSGPNLAIAHSAATNASGIASVSFTSSLAGTDTIQCSMVNSSSVLQYSNLVTRTWTGTSQMGYSFVLGPDGAMNPVGAPHTVSFKIWSTTSSPVPNVPVTFKVLTGPNAGMVLGMASTNIFGIATATYASALTGTDTIQATAQVGINMLPSNIVSKIWVAGGVPQLILSPVMATNPVKGQHTLTATAYDATNTVRPGVQVKFDISSGPNVGAELITTTSFPSGSAKWTWSSNAEGTDTIEATATIDGTPVTSNVASKTWAGLLCDVDNNGQIDNRDISAIFAARNTLVLPGDVRDADFDGAITALDMRKCTLMCTKAGCAQ